MAARFHHRSTFDIPFFGDSIRLLLSALQPTVVFYLRTTAAARQSFQRYVSIRGDGQLDRLLPEAWLRLVGTAIVE